MYYFHFVFSFCFHTYLLNTCLVTVFFMSMCRYFYKEKKKKKKSRISLSNTSSHVVENK